MANEAFKDDAERAIASVVELEYPLYKVEVRVYDGRACCPCCEHWEAVWSAARRTGQWPLDR